jgi:membrane protein DedA with SNARE-associated domain
MGMPEKKFQLANILSGILWIPALLAPGYLTAISIDAARHSRESLVYSGLGFAVLIGIAVLIWITRSTHQKKRRYPTLHK